MFYSLKASPIQDRDGLVYNSINLIEGPQGCGKSHLMEDLIRRHRLAFDEVYRVAPARTITDQEVHSPEELEEWLLKCDREAVQRKEDLKIINGFAFTLQRPDLGIHLPKRLPDILAKYKHAADVERPVTRLLAIDDFGGHPMLRNANSAFSRAARQLRHSGTTALICCHNIRDVSPAIRSYTGAVNLFAGVPRYDLQELWKNKGVPFDSYREFVDAYADQTRPTATRPYPFMRLTFVR